MKCRVPGCTKKKAKKFSCSRCRLKFCSWHLLFLEECDDKSIDFLGALCLCCHLGITREATYRDAPVSDSLARALVSADPLLRKRVLDWQLAWTDAQDAAFGPDGPNYFHPGMAEPPDPDVKEFVLQHQGR